MGNSLFMGCGLTAQMFIIKSYLKSLIATNSTVLPFINGWYYLAFFSPIRKWILID